MKTILHFGILILFSMQLVANPQDGVRPSFPGGSEALFKFLDENLKYPEQAQQEKWQGKTLVGFTVNEDGTLSNIRVVKSSWTILDQEALRIIKMMPKWIPANFNGIAQKEMVVLPIVFDLTRKNIKY
ncbi:MAG: energy transducer TonB [Bacteroidetes bacterium]|nr:energy transducer TonB [Bacteroidota bacterium]